MNYASFQTVSKHLKITLLLGLIFILSSISGCSLPENKSPVTKAVGPKNICLTDTDCLSGTCYKNKNFCAQFVQKNSYFTAKLIIGPNSSKPGRNWNFQSVKPFAFEVDAQSTDKFKHSLAEPVSVKGLTSKITADIIFKQIISAPLTEDEITYTYKTYGEQANFYVFPGKYNIKIVPVGDKKNAFPIFYLKNIEIKEDGNPYDETGLPVEIKLPYELPEEQNEYSQIRGKVFYTEPLTDPVAATDLFIKAYESKTGDLLYQTKVKANEQSSNTENFKVILPPNVEEVALHFYRPTETIFPTFIHTITDFEQEPTIEIPRLNLPIWITGLVNRPSGISETGFPPTCRILFEKTDLENRQVTYYAKTDETGTLQRLTGETGVYLYEGQYRITAFPESSSTLDGKSFKTTTLPYMLDVKNVEDESNSLTEETSTQQPNHFELQLEVLKSIHVNSTAQNQAIGHVSIFASNIEDGNTSAYSSNISDAQGSTNFWLDEGVYFATASPPPNSNFAFGTALWNVFSFEQSSATIQLQIPFVIEGEIHMNSDNPLFSELDFSNAHIEWYKSFGKNYHLVGYSELNNDGSFIALLPAQNTF